ncbi:hypothetical protein [Enterovibrio calviensis]|uniref:hypothetical protein n=1 Tax=Enterovibrio calviensis TaxID=91359 RepID=UPI000A505744|nr:hypothetical protein [Enterovibrio calviensis]
MPLKNTQKTAILSAFGHFFLFSILVALPVAILKLDLNVLKNDISEQSLTEYSEKLLLVATILCYLYVAKIDPSFRRFSALVIGFFACMLIRELDKFFDDWVMHGFWKYPVTLVAASAILYSLLNKAETMKGFSDFVSHRYFSILSLGLALLLVFSRLFGMSSLWEDVLTNGYVRTAKNVAEEGTELMAYFTIFYASLRYALDKRRRSIEHHDHYNCDLNSCR